MIKLKQLFIFSIFLASSTLTGTSCKKQTTDPKEDTTVLRKIQFSHYTNSDLSEDNNNISFTVLVEDLQNHVLWDSALAPMKIKDIPDLAHKLFIEKTVTDDGSQILKVGFNYSIENVGYSWFYDTCSAGETFKKVDFNFQ